LQKIPAGDIGAWFLFQDSAPEVKADKECVLAAVKKFGYALEYASDDLKANKEVVLTAVTKSGDALKYVNKKAPMWADKDFVMSMVKLDGAALKYAQGGLSQDPECLKIAGFLDGEENTHYDRPEKAILSIKFGLTAESTGYSLNFIQAMKADQFLNKFKTYDPTITSKDYCREKLGSTSVVNHCRGTLESCNFPRSRNLKTLDDKEQPAKKSCWRFAFRFHQQECKDTCGFMIQAEEKEGLGDGQKLETEMAREVGLKVFRTYTNYSGVDGEDMGRISNAVKEWYESGCANTDLENVFIGTTFLTYTERPKYEAL